MKRTKAPPYTLLRSTAPSTMIQLLFGDSPQSLIWRALIPALLLVAWFVVGLAIYAIRCQLRGRYRDSDIEAKSRSPLLGLWLRQYFVWITRVLWKALEATGIPANTVTTLSMLQALASAIALAAGHFALGGWLYIFSGILDTFDGRLARKQHTDGPAGAALDSVLDRYADGAVLCGLAWYYRESWVFVPVLGALSGGFLVSYIRARGEGLGVQISIGLMQRPERIVCLGVATGLSPVVAAWQAPGQAHPTHWLAASGLVFLALSSQWTAIHRLTFLLSKLSSSEHTGFLSRGEGGLLRSIAAASLATSIDFAVVWSLVALSDWVPWSATSLGCTAGGVVSFFIGRTWAFRRSATTLRAQGQRDLFVSATSMLLNMGGVAVFSLLPAIDYRVGWLLARLAVFALWNFPLQRDYVFRQATRDARSPSIPSSLTLTRTQSNEHNPLTSSHS